LNGEAVCTFFLLQLKTNLSLLSYFCRARKGQDLYYSDFTAFVFEGSVLDVVLIGIIRASTIIVAAAVFSTTVSIRLVLPFFWLSCLILCSLWLPLVAFALPYRNRPHDKTRDRTRQEAGQNDKRQDKTRQHNTT
jgi:hypothetical protein